MAPPTKKNIKEKFLKKKAKKQKNIFFSEPARNFITVVEEAHCIVRTGPKLAAVLPWAGITGLHHQTGLRNSFFEEKSTLEAKAYLIKMKPPCHTTHLLPLGHACHLCLSHFPCSLPGAVDPALRLLCRDLTIEVKNRFTGDFVCRRQGR